ncbi:MAG: sigma-70 family RNA polymerase sigma factor [Ruminococcaceae bacterium]|nr:sigma-70 family RNA polymerase sigma factor [Oscillospiraceae bacterium]
MDRKRAAELLAENITAIYGYAHNKLYDPTQADDLAGEIVCQVLTSSDRLREESAFWGFVWRIADNTLRTHLRREKLRARILAFPDEGSEWSLGIYVPSPADTYAEQEVVGNELYLLRRELATLSRHRREVTVAYYVGQKSCATIARELGISVDMVKYHLSQARKQLKEGMNMTRKYGEKSYDPGVFRLDFWGDNNHYGRVFDRRLPGALMLAAYGAPMTEEELSIETGVPAVYLEDELDTLIAAGLMAKQGSRYRTNLIIVTDIYEKEFIRRTAEAYETLACELYEAARGLLPNIRSLDFSGRDYDDNRLLWTMLNIVLYRGYEMSCFKSPVSDPPALPLGGNGFLFGYDNNYENHHFGGIAGHVGNKEGTAWFSAVNYRVAITCQKYDYFRFREKGQIMCDVILGQPSKEDPEVVAMLIRDHMIESREGILAPLFPVFTEESIWQLEEMMIPLRDKIGDFMISISDKAEALLRQYVPHDLTATLCGISDIAKIHHRLDVMAFVVETMVKKGLLTVPEEPTNLTIFGVKV